MSNWTVIMWTMELLLLLFLSEFSIDFPQHHLKYVHTELLRKRKGESLGGSQFSGIGLVPSRGKVTHFCGVMAA